ncbi:type I restriction enzyme HsdR N-terminal domain-containing protein [Arcticibacter eurypsychrophilus]|uniref:type I restriction enzyme HsdR N-terminal domain-containing protein n=1 Tax=Arcticibacter eurypsychrophilus TaxID=1434752 RepID=UPI00084CFD9E|nr:type I restriction enzyme HsdR N-terminal domain-containing protein [Arcticibacter eurypsychrophilus]
MQFDPVKLNLPYYPFRIKQIQDTNYIFDEIRKKFLVLTPEEWVRQHIVQYIIQEKGYPKSLIKLEGGLKLNTLQKRTDLIAYNSSGQKILLIECKAPGVKIDQKVFDQIARYNIIHRIPLLAVTNGLNHYYCQIDFELKSYIFIESLPHYTDLG